MNVAPLSGKEINAEQTSSRKEGYPRLLLVDLTRVGDATATGEVKANILGDWPSDKLLQVHAAGRRAIGIAGHQARSPIATAEAMRVVENFKPQIILYRPVPDAPALHAFAISFIREHADVPLATWIMDDWPARLEVDDPVQFKSMNADWIWLIKRSTRLFSIGSSMSDVFMQRYGYRFEPFANGVAPHDWPDRNRLDDKELLVRYAGALADNMTAQSVLRVSQAVEKLANEGCPVRMEIRTRDIWHERQKAHYAGIRATRFVTEQATPVDYRQWLTDAGLLVIGYNFDPESLRYIGLSLANKMPECLASGTPLLAHGPLQAATISYLKHQDCALIVDIPEVDAVKEAIRSMLDHPDMRQSLGSRGRIVAFRNHNLSDIQERFRMAITSSSTQISRTGTAAAVLHLREHDRSEGIAVDETEVVSLLLADRRGRGHLMLDVGAHFGTSAAFFDKLGWTIHCFEPDPSNRAKLVAKFGTADNVTIDTRAVSDKPATGVSFFKSDESTGISGLHAFRDTHREDGKVDVTTVAEIVETRGIDHVDFLKIDVEGFDFSVLKGVPWDRVKPDVIECEFEDYKTVPLGHTYREVAQFLHDQGYAVYLSEWHPIVRYGIRHDWRRVVPFPGIELKSDAWGNILAFRNDPGLEAINTAFEKAMNRRPDAAMPKPAATGERPIAAPPPPTPPVQAKPAAAPAQTAPVTPVASTSAPQSSFRKRMAEQLRHRSFPAFQLALFTLWCLRALRRRPLMALVAVALPIATAVAAYLYPQPEIRLPAVAATSALLVLYASAALVGFLATRVKTVILQLRGELAGHQQTLAGVRAETGALRAAHGRDAEAVRARSAEMSKRLAAAEAALTPLRQVSGTRIDQIDETLDALTKRFAPLDYFVASFSQRMDQLEPAVEAIRESLEVGRFNARFVQVEQESRRLSDELSTTIKSEIARVERTFAPSPTYNIGLYQRFGRRLPEARAREMAEKWSKLLDTSLSRQRLGYLANRACVLETMMKGRLATAIETIVLRSVVTASPKGENVSILEIGTLFGVGAAAVYEAARNEHENVHLTVLDPLDGYYATGKMDLLTGAEISEQTLRQNFATAPVPLEDYTIIKGLSTQDEAFEVAAKRQYDVLIIDGDHSYEGVKYDFDRYAPLVRPGGYILFDDYDVEDWPDIKRYVDTEIAPREDVTLVGSDYRTAVYRVASPIQAIATTPPQADSADDAKTI